METLIASAAPLIEQYGYWIILPLSMFAGPIIGVISGFLVSVGTLDWLLVFLALEAGDIIGDVAFYYLGYFAHRPVTEPIARFLGATPQGEARLKRAFEKNSTKIILINKLNAAGAVVLYYAGAIRIPFWPYLFWNAISSVPKVILFEVIGYYFGESYQEIHGYIGVFNYVSLIIPLGLIAAYFVATRVSRRVTHSES